MIGFKVIVGLVENDFLMLYYYIGLIGISIFGVFLYLIGIFNVIVLVGIVCVFVYLCCGDYDEVEFE